ncbi:MAG TPA: zinc-dependent metalloprotease [Fimbriimonadaceae bacterium]|nr:zinc-dependent metalloprotease [Fimbriimonadaceae bacterium]
MTASLAAALLLFPVTSFAQGQPATTTGQEPKKAEDDPYTKAIKDYTAQDGVFKVWRNKESVMFEIPKPTMSRDFLWVTELKQTPRGMYNGTAVAENVVRWEERDEKVLLRLIDYTVVATGLDAAIQSAVKQSTVSPIIRSFDIKARSKDGAALIDVSSYYKSDIPEFSVRGAVSGQAMDSSRTFIEKIAVFPNNVNIEILATFIPGPSGPSFFGGPVGNGPRTCVISHSMSLLPEKPMMGRLKDSRVGYFSTGKEDYGTDYHGVKEYQFISRYRLEKKDPSAALSEPVKPIIYYISREVPAKWRKYIKEGIEDWQPAFEAAGFKNAIICKDAPTEQEDPNWSPEDSRFSVIRWAPLPIENAMGPSTVDPRSGEIISAHIIMWHDILKLQTDWYFSQASVSDPASRRLPFSDELQGYLLRFVVAHEVGHTLGLPHNGKSSGMIPISKLRDAKWCAENGTCTSIMDYARFNYVAQPEDKVAPKDLVPKVGKYDKFSIHWGYAPIPGARSPFDEVPTLDRWAAAQVTDPELRFYDNFNSMDPTAQAEALGNNAVQASSLGVKNMKKMVGYLKPAAVKLGEDYSELARLHSALTGQYRMYVSHVGVVLGGVEMIDYRGGRGGAVFNPVSREYQVSAVTWILDNTLTPPTWLFPKDVMNKIAPDGGAGQLAALATQGSNALLNDARLNRMLQAEAMGHKGLTVQEMLDIVRPRVWAELKKPTVPITMARRAAQRAWVTSLTRKLGSSSDIRAFAMGELEAELQAITGTIPAVTDRASRAHLKELKKQIEFSLANPDKVAPAGGGGMAFPFMNGAHRSCSMWCPPVED